MRWMDIGGERVRIAGTVAELMRVWQPRGAPGDDALLDCAELSEVLITALRADRRAIGWASAAAREDADGAELTAWVSEDARGRGLGTALVSRALDALRRRGRVRATCMIPKGDSAVGFAHRCGFEPFGEMWRMAYAGGILDVQDRACIRNYSDEWFARVISLRNAGVAEAGLLYGMEYPALFEADDADLRSAMRRSCALEFVAVEGEKLLGFCRADRDTGEVGALNVVPAARGTGLGEQLMRRCVNALAARGQSAHLYVSERNAPALAIYRSIGFEIEEEYLTFLRGL
ncbi:MAG: GNAT family N-acetyltransferase [Clostridia bacterium]|nr:GNAT family N-acetyltransferase [Clostridia bacterium]